MIIVLVFSELFNLFYCFLSLSLYMCRMLIALSMHSLLLDMSCVCVCARQLPFAQCLCFKAVGPWDRGFAIDCNGDRLTPLFFPFPTLPPSLLFLRPSLILQRETTATTTNIISKDRNPSSLSITAHRRPEHRSDLLFDQPPQEAFNLSHTAGPSSPCVKGVMSKIEAALEIPEVLSRIIGQADSKDQTVAARTSKAWNEAALNCIWRRLDSIVPLLKILSPLRRIPYPSMWVSLPPSPSHQIQFC